MTVPSHFTGEILPGRLDQRASSIGAPSQGGPRQVLRPGAPRVPNGPVYIQ